MRIGTIKSTGEIIIAASLAEWMHFFRYTTMEQFEQDYDSVQQLLIDQWDLPICPRCFQFYGNGPAVGLYANACGDCQGGDDPRYDPEPVTSIDPDTGRRIG